MDPFREQACLHLPSCDCIKTMLRLPCPDSTFHETNMALEKLGFEDAFLADSFGEGFPMGASC